MKLKFIYYCHIMFINYYHIRGAICIECYTLSYNYVILPFEL